MLAAVPNFGSWQARSPGQSWLHLDIPRHLYHFTKRSLTKIFEAAGFGVQGVSYGEIEYDVIGWSQGLLNLRFRGRNEFFKAVSGKSGRKWSLHRAIQIPAGLGLSLLATIPAWAECFVGRAGTLILTARSPEARESAEMYHSKKIVVVMPAYNAERTLMQTYGEIDRDSSTR